MQLISMTDFVFNQINQKQSCSEFKESVKKYAELLKTPLKLEMFFPCDLHGNILEEPEPNDLCGSFFKMQTGFSDDVKYSYAKDRVIFKGFKIVTDQYYSTKREFIWLPDNVTQVWRRLTFHTGKIESHFFDYYDEFKTVGDLVKYKLEFTQNAIKQLGL